MSLIEVMLSVLLVSLLATGVLGTVRVSVMASSRNRDAANASAWLQTASDRLELVPRQLCAPTDANIIADYTQEVQSNTSNSEGWPGSRISVESVQFWDGTQFTSQCLDSDQLVTLKVVSPDGTTTRRLQVVKTHPIVDLSVLPNVADPSSSCTVSSYTVRDKAGNTQNIPLKKPSTTKTSSIKHRPLTITLTTTGVCYGTLRMSYQWPHRNHFHNRRVMFKLQKGTTNVFVAKMNKRDKFLKDQKLTMTVEQGRAKSKYWRTITNGVVANKLQFK